MNCPKCNLINPENAMWCDCGYNFSTKTMNQPASNLPQDAGGQAGEITRAEIGDRKILAQIAGNNRFIAVTDDIVFVGSSGIASGSFFGKKVKRYPIDFITSVDVRNALLTVELEIVMAGASEAGRTDQSFVSRSENENITMFQKKQYERVQQVAGLIMTIQQQRKMNTNRQSVQKTESSKSIPQQIRELAELKEAGIITSEEFEQKKKELLSRM